MKSNSEWEETTAGFSQEAGSLADLYSATSLLPTLTIMSHPNLSRIGQIARLDNILMGRETVLSRTKLDFTAPGSVWGEPLSDPFLSRKPLNFRPLPNGFLELDCTKCRTIVQVQGHNPGQSFRFSVDEIQKGVVIQLARRIVLLLHHTRPPREEGVETFNLLGGSDAMMAVRLEIQRVADLDVSILVRGPSGAGKELVARGIHEAGPRKDKPFISVNLGAIAPSLAVSELFGSTKGAYTGATRDKPGFFGAADGGTLFLDEIGEASMEIQAMLLRTLETGEIHPVGSAGTRHVDVRVISATDADLEEMVQDKRFKEPLLHRLSGYSIFVPSLSQRREDIGRLLIHFAALEMKAIGESARLEMVNPSNRPWLPAPLMARLVSFSWPGNVRQLRNLVRQMIIGSRGHETLQAGPALDKLLTTHGNDQKETPKAKPESDKPILTRRKSPIKPSKITEEELIAALHANKWNIKATATSLDISRSSLYNLMENCDRIRTIEQISEKEVQESRDRHQGDVEAMAAHLMVSKNALERKLKKL